MMTCKGSSEKFAFDGKEVKRLSRDPSQDRDGESHSEAATGLNHLSAISPLK